MSEGSAVIAAQTVRLAAEVPASLIECLANEIAACGVQDWGYARQQILQVTPQPRFRALVEELLSAWRTEAAGMRPESVALALRAASATAQHYREVQSVELV